MAERRVVMPLAMRRAATIWEAKTQPAILVGSKTSSATDATMITTPSWRRLTRGTFFRPTASWDQNMATMLPNMGAAKMTLMRVMEASKFLAATTEVKEPSASEAARGKVMAARIS
jgi:hypothetical protein